MKIKVAHGVDMRLWRYDVGPEQSVDALYGELLAYILKSFGFGHLNEFTVTFEDDQGGASTISSEEDFAAAIVLARNANRKSLKLRIVNLVEGAQHQQTAPDDEEKSAVEHPIASALKSQQNAHEVNQGPFNGFAQFVPPSPPHFRGRGRGRGRCRGRGRGCGRGRGRGHRHRGHHGPSQQEIASFLGDDVAVQLLADLLANTFEAVRESNFSVPLHDTLRAVALSDSKYEAVVGHAVWPFFVNELVPRAAPKIMFFAQMLAANGNGDAIDGDALRQWIPTMLRVMGQNAKSGHFGCHRGRGWRGRRHRGHHRRGRGGFGPFGHGPYGPFGSGSHEMVFEGGADREEAASAPVAAASSNLQNDAEDAVFEYTEELVAVMNMGFSDMERIKRLLTEHGGNKQTVVQELVSVR